jgi:hypothetical protein
LRICGPTEGAGTADLSKQRSELAQEQTLAVRFKNAVMRGDYVSLEVFARKVDAMFTVVRERVLSVAGKASHACEMRTRDEIDAIFREELYEALNELSNLHMSEEEAIDARLRQSLLLLRPPPKLTLIEWADQSRYVAARTSASPGRWKTIAQPCAFGPMAAVTRQDTHTITIMAATQVIKTELLINIYGYFIAQDPSMILFVQPTQMKAEEFSKERFAPKIGVSFALGLRQRLAKITAWRLCTVIIPRRTITGRLVRGQVWRRHDSRHWLYKKFTA